MKQSIILWTAAAIITLLAGYAQSIKSPYYPVNGTITVVSGYASFSFDKVFRGKGGYPVWIVADFDSLKGELKWRDTKGNNEWKTIQMKPKGQALYAEIPAHPPLSKVEYRVTLNDHGKTFLVPQTEIAHIQFLGHVPPPIMAFYYITLFAGILLAVRTGFEVFKDKPRIKMYTIFTLISFFSFTLIFSTVKKGCELGAIGGTKILPISDLFTNGPVLLFVLWIAALILIFNSKKYKIWAPVSAFITILIFLLANF